MNEHQKRVGKARFKEIDNAWILVSATWKEQDGPDRMVTANMSFFYDAGNIGTEWEPQHGPITTWCKCEAPGDGIKEHYFYDFVARTPLTFAQGAVYKLGLPAAFQRGDYAYIFAVLKDWAESR